MSVHHDENITYAEHYLIDIPECADVSVTTLPFSIRVINRFMGTIQSISEMRSTVFDSDLLWVLEGMQLIDANQRTRLASCFDMRCHSGHPGEAPITKYNVLSCFSDVVEIVLANPTFEIKK